MSKGICDKTSNNKFFDCPPMMADGRNFTDYRSNRYVNQLVAQNNNVQSSNQYRKFLMNNAEGLMELSHKYLYQKNGCNECDAQKIPIETMCKYNSSYGTCYVNSTTGLGIQNVGDGMDGVQKYQPQTQSVATFDKPTYYTDDMKEVDYAGIPGLRCEDRN
jgi:hypothetical protein